MAETKIGKYTITGEIGKGAMGIVYQGIDPYIGRTLAIKTIRFDLLSHPDAQKEAQKRFMREARSAGNLSHPHIVTIYEVGEDAGMTYIAMEYIDGQSLEELMASGKNFSLEEIINLISQIGAALDYAHEKGIIHRDIKPGNILIDQAGNAHLVDFGIARITTSTTAQTNTIMGTPFYMSPEQVVGKKIDGRSDIFSLGTILYELLTQKKAFPGENITTVIYNIMNETPPSLRTYKKDFPEGLDYIINKVLNRQPEERYQNCQELLDDLKNYPAFSSFTIPEDREFVREVQSPRKASPAPAIDSGKDLYPVQPQMQNNKRPILIVLGAMMVIIIVVLTVVFLSIDRSGKPGFSVSSPPNQPANKPSSINQKTKPAKIKVVPKKTVPKKPSHSVPQSFYEKEAWDALNDDNSQELKQNIETGLKFYPGSSKLWGYKAVLYLMKREDPRFKELALESVNRAIELDPSEAVIYAILKPVLNEMGDVNQYERRETAYARNHPELYYNLATFYNGVDEKNEAIQYCEKFLTVAPKHRFAADARKFLAELTGQSSIITINQVSTLAIDSSYFTFYPAVFVSFDNAKIIKLPPTEEELEGATINADMWIELRDMELGSLPGELEEIIHPGNDTKVAVVSGLGFESIMSIPPDIEWKNVIYKGFVKPGLVFLVSSSSGKIYKVRIDDLSVEQNIMKLSFAHLQ